VTIDVSQYGNDAKKFCVYRHWNRTNAQTVIDYYDTAEDALQEVTRLKAEDVAEGFNRDEQFYIIKAGKFE
jgi:predicted DNA-binding WGR domain protein